MVKKNLLYFLVVLMLAVVVVYSIPTKKKSFAEYYDGPLETQEALFDFREYPVDTLVFAGLDWHYLSIGEGKRSLLFLHGMGGAYDIWFQQIEALKDSFQIISLTLPEVRSLAEATAGILHILEHREIDKVCVVGSSMGGFIAQYLWQKHPDRIERIVLGNTFPPNQVYQEEHGKLRGVVPLLPEWLIMHIFRKKASTSVFPASGHSELLKGYLLEQYSGLMSKQQFIGRFDIVLEQFEVTPPSDQIPVLIIESDNDPLVKEDLRIILKETYPHAEVLTFAGKGHFPYLNQSDEYTIALRQFLSLN